MKKPPKGSDYLAYLHKKHAKFATSQKIIDRVIFEASGSLPIRTERIIKGEVNEVYDIRTKNRQDLILRISNKLGIKPFEREKWAIGRVRKLGVPVPEILQIKKIRKGSENLAICIMKKIKGQPLNEIKNRINKDDFRRIINSAGEVLTKIHSVRTNGYGGLNKKGKGDCKNIKEHLLSVLKMREKLLIAAKKVKLPASVIKQGLKIIENSAKSYKHSDPRLLHWDYSSKHFLINRKTIVGIIDWANCKGSDPIQEFARWAYYNGNEEVKWLMEGYKNKSLFDGKFYEKLYLWKIFFGMDVLEYYAREQNQSGIRHSKQQLQEDLNYYKKHF